MIVEICCGSYQDGMTAYQYGAKRIELNSALSLGGLTPSLASLRLLKAQTDLTIICMVRPRGAGFDYRGQELVQIQCEAEMLLENGADGLAFGFLNDDHTIDIPMTKFMVDLCHQYHKVAVFHRAFDCCNDLDVAIKQLIDLKVDRVLTSGGKATALEGQECLRYLVDTYGEQIEILAGSGINADNAKDLIAATHVSQIHASCKDYATDVTTTGRDVSYAYYSNDHECDYEYVSGQNVLSLLDSVK